MTKRLSRKKIRAKLWVKVIVIVLSFFGLGISYDQTLESELCKNLPLKEFDYNYWVVCEQFRLANSYHSSLTGETPNEEKPQVEEADAL